MADFRVFVDGSISLVTPETVAARVWLSEHVSSETPWVGKGLTVGLRFLEALIAGIEGDGLTVTLRSVGRITDEDTPA